jgi:hypothetical protein
MAGAFSQKGEDTGHRLFSDSRYFHLNAQLCKPFALLSHSGDFPSLLI